MFFSRLHKRKFERVKPLDSAPVEVQIMGSDSIDILKAFDISTRGIGVQTPNYYKAKNSSENVELVISLPHSKSFMAKGIIRHVSKRTDNSPRFGVEFTDIAGPNLDKIKMYIESISSASAMAS